MIYKTKLYSLVCIYLLCLSSTYADTKSASFNKKAGKFYYSQKTVSAYDGSPDVTINLRSRKQSAVDQFSNMQIELIPIYQGDIAQAGPIASDTHRS